MSSNIQTYNIPYLGTTLSITNTPSQSNKILTILLDISKCIDYLTSISPVTLNLNFNPSTPDGFILNVKTTSINPLKCTINLIINNINSSNIFTSYTYPDSSLYFVYSNNNWNHTSSEKLIQIVLTSLAGDIPSIENPITTNDTVSGIIKDAMYKYLDAIPSNGTTGAIATLSGLPDDLYNLLDVSSNLNTSNPIKNRLGDNKLVTTEFNDYLNYFIAALKENPSFVSSVANQIVTQCNLNNVSLELGSIITLTYPTFLRQSSPYISYIIPVDAESTNSSIDAVVLNTGSQITYLGSNITPINTQSLGIQYNIITHYSSPFRANGTSTFTIISSSIDFNFSDNALKGIYMLDSNGNLIRDTQTSLVNNTITYNISYLEPPPNLPFYIYILYNNNIYYNGEVGIYINEDPIPPTPDPTPAPIPYLPSYEFSIVGNVISENLQDSVNDNSLTVTPNTLINFTITACDTVFDETYTIQLAILKPNSLTILTEVTPFKLNTTLNVINLRLYGYDQLSDPLESSYNIVAIITQLNGATTEYPYGYYTSVYTMTPVNLIVIPVDEQPTPLASFINNESDYLFPLYNFTAIQGDTINFCIYSRHKFTKNVIYFNGQELIAYSKTTNNNTYSGGSTSYVNYDITTKEGEYARYQYYVIIPIRLTLPASLPSPDSIGTKYYITVATTMLDDDGNSYSTYYSAKELTLHLQLTTQLVVHGYLVNGIVTPSIINNGIENLNPRDVNAFATVNGLIVPPNNSLFYYQTADGYNGYFYIKMSNLVKYETPAPIEGLFTLQGQGYGIITTPIAPTSYHTIINDMIDYFIKMAIQFGFIFRSEIEAYENNNFNQEYLNLKNLINYIELSTRNTYLCGKYTTNIYLVGNSIPIGTSYYPNDVEYQGATGSIPSSGPFAPNPDINGLINGTTGATGGISSLYYTGVTGTYWGIIDEINGDTQISIPSNWKSGLNIPSELPSTTSVGDFKGVNSISELNATLLKYSMQLNYCSKNIIIIPEEYIGYGIIDDGNIGACSQPDYILTIYLNTYGIYDSSTSGNNGCSADPTTLNGSVISPGTEVNIINNSPNAIIKVVSYNLATDPPTPLIINLGNTTMDSLFIKATDSMHLIFGGSTWGIL